jgi:YD repeat-containing protein
MRTRHEPAPAGTTTIGALILAIALLGAAAGHAETVRYTYDAAGRLVAAQADGGTEITYAYDASGNLLARRVSVEVEPCAPGPTTLCLNQGRFRVEADWRTRNASGAARVVALTGDSGYLTFFDAANLELVVKVLDACGVPGAGNFWVLAAGLTNQEVTLTVTDTATGERFRSANPLDRTFETVAETGAFKGSCGATGPVAAGRRASSAAVAPSPPAPKPGAAGDCAAGAKALCLNQGRFRVEAAWRTKDANGTGDAKPLTADSGYFTFFDAANVEVVVKVLDACGLPGAGNFWVFAGGLTDQRVTLTVTDTATGEVYRHVNPLGTLFATLTETGVFKGSC